MSIGETLFTFWQVLCVACFSAQVLICAGLGAYELYKTWQAGAEKNELERIARRGVNMPSRLRYWILPNEEKEKSQ